ncbi:hypothetical protein GCM10007919_15380 [Rhizobium indigoferae]|nr:hypothetical protein GCM10007919_15380 [Rhizobium indigoferae]
MNPFDCFAHDAMIDAYQTIVFRQLGGGPSPPACATARHPDVVLGFQRASQQPIIFAEGVRWHAVSEQFALQSLRPKGACGLKTSAGTSSAEGERNMTRPGGNGKEADTISIS